MIKGTTRWGPSLEQRMISFYREGRFRRWLKRSARALNMPEGDLGTHSLRFGGASAIWAAYGRAPWWRDGAGGPQTLSRRTCGIQGKQHRTSRKRWPRWTWPCLIPRRVSRPGVGDREPSPSRSVARFAPGRIWGGGSLQGQAKNVQWSPIGWSDLSLLRNRAQKVCTHQLCPLSWKLGCSGYRA